MKEASPRLLADIAARIASLSRDLSPEAIDPDDGLLDAGYVDSMAVADLVTILEHDYGVRVEGERLLGDLYTLRALANWIACKEERAS